MLALASAEGGADIVPKISVDLTPLLREMMDDLTTVAAQAGLSLRLEIPDQLPCLQANPEQISIVIRNLLDNAIKYSRPSGSITLTVRSLDHGVELAVSDTGPGIPAEALPHIFERFYRVDPAHSRRQGGAGLGLALVREIVDRHGGRIDVQSRVGEGSTFTVYLPC